MDFVKIKKKSDGKSINTIQSYDFILHTLLYDIQRVFQSRATCLCLLQNQFSHSQGRQHSLTRPRA